MTAQLIVFAFVVGYFFIILEFYFKVNKTAVGILLASVCWIIYFSGSHDNLGNLRHLSEHLGSIGQIIFFLLGAMTLVELIDSHKGFNFIVDLLNIDSKRKMLLFVCVTSFFLSAVLDNLATIILMLSLIKKLIPLKKERLLFCCMSVISVNAGGAWTPIGDVTTTMLWINHKITTSRVMFHVFLPSVVSVVVPFFVYCLQLRGDFSTLNRVSSKELTEPGARLVFVMGVLSLMSVPLIKYLTGIPPFIGILLALGLIWLLTDIMHYKHENRNHLRVPFILTKIDVSSILFFLGILLAVAALESVDILYMLARYMEYLFDNNFVGIAVAIGFISSIIDNVPIVAAAMGMYNNLPVDSDFWLLLAFTAGTGGSLLSIGSVAGVALMGIEKVSFMAYFRKCTFPAILGYISGVLVYLFI